MSRITDTRSMFRTRRHFGLPVSGSLLVGLCLWLPLPVYRIVALWWMRRKHGAPVHVEPGFDHRGRPVWRIHFEAVQGRAAWWSVGYCEQHALGIALIHEEAFWNNA